MVFWASFYLPHISAHHRSKWDPTGTWGSLSQPAHIQGSTGRWLRSRGWGQGGTCSSSRWWSQAARSKCRSSAPLLALERLALRSVGRRGEDQNGKMGKITDTIICWHILQWNGDLMLFFIWDQDKNKTMLDKYSEGTLLCSNRLCGND